MDGEVLVVVHRAPVARGQRAQDHRGGADLVVERGQLVARGHVVEQEARRHACTVMWPRPGGSRTRCRTRPPPARRPGWCRRRRSPRTGPCPSFVVFSSLTERSTWWVRSTSPMRTGAWNSMVLSVMTASGRPKRSFRSKCTCSGSACSVRPGAQWCGRNQTETMVGGATGPARQRVGHLVVPEERVAVLHRGARRPDVAALDGELPHLVVLLLADEIAGLGQCVAGVMPPPSGPPSGRPSRRRRRPPSRGARCRSAVMSGSDDRRRPAAPFRPGAAPAAAARLRSGGVAVVTARGLRPAGGRPPRRSRGPGPRRCRPRPAPRPTRRGCGWRRPQRRQPGWRAGRRRRAGNRPAQDTRARAQRLAKNLDSIAPTASHLPSPAR